MHAFRRSALLSVRVTSRLAFSWERKKAIVATESSMPDAMSCGSEARLPSRERAVVCAGAYP